MGLWKWLQRCPPTGVMQQVSTFSCPSSLISGLLLPPGILALTPGCQACLGRVKPSLCLPGPWDLIGKLPASSYIMKMLFSLFNLQSDQRQKQHRNCLSGHTEAGNNCDSQEPHGRWENGSAGGAHCSGLVAVTKFTESLSRSWKP